MKGLFRFAFVVLLLVGWGLASLALHVVRTPKDTIVIIPKDKLGFTDTYVDARLWQMQDLVNHPSLAKRIVESGKAEQFGYVTGDPEADKTDIESAIQAALRAAPAPPPPATKKGDDKRMSASAQDAAKAWWEMSKK